MKLHSALALALLTCCSATAFAQKGPANKTDRAENAVPAATAGNTSLACYFQKDGSNTWYWGLTSNSAWYEMPGDWQTTPLTKLQKFFSTASESQIRAACANTQTYYGLVGYTLQAAFAAQKSAGYNYPIIINGNTELWPQY